MGNDVKKEEIQQISENMTGDNIKVLFEKYDKDKSGKFDKGKEKFKKKMSTQK